MGKSEPNRLHHLDAIRVSAILLLVPYHAARFLQKGSSDSRLVDGWVWWLHTWHLPLFFAISGFLAASALSRSTAGSQVRSRLQRLGLPFAVGMFTVVPLANLLVTVMAHTRERSQKIPDERGYQLDHIFTTAPRHLWFIEYLLLLSLIAVGIWWAVRKAPGFLDRTADRLGDLIASPFAMFPLALAGAAILYTKSGWAPGGSEANSIVPVPSLLAYYGLFFGAGWLLSRRDVLLARLQRDWWFRLGLVAIITIPVFALFYEGGTFTGPKGWDGRLVDDPSLRFVGLFAFGVVGWSMVLGIWGFLASRIHAPSPALSYLSDASFWIYLIHIPFLVVVQSMLAETGLAAEIRYPLTIFLTLALSLASYAIFVRRTPIGTFLHGPRPKGKAKPAPKPEPVPG